MYIFLYRVYVDPSTWRYVFTDITPFRSRLLHLDYVKHQTQNIRHTVYVMQVTHKVIFW